MSDFKKILNKGVPLSTPLDLYINDLTDMSNDPEKFLEKINNEYEKIIMKLYDTNKIIDIEWFMTLAVVSDPETLEKRLHFSPNGFTSTILFNLNVDRICTQHSQNEDEYAVTDIDEFLKKYDKKFLKRIDKLKNLKNEGELSNSFPMLSKIYKREKQLYTQIKESDYYKRVQKIKERINNPLVSYEELEYMKKELKAIETVEAPFGLTLNDLFTKAEKFSFRTFCRSAGNMFEYLVKNMDKIIDYLIDTEIDIDGLDIDNDKLELYIAHKSMMNCFIDKEDCKQRYIYYVANYFMEDKERKNSDTPEITIEKVEHDIVKMPEELKYGKTITPKKLYETYRDFLIKNPDVKVIDFSKIDFSGMNLEEVEIFIMEYLKDIQMNWDIIPENELEKGFIKNYNELNDEKTLEEKAEEKQKHLERLMELYIDKKEFYASTNPFMRVRGKNTFDGYIGFLYANGKVVLDKFYEDSDKSKLADGEAIYIMDISDFHRLSQHTKSVLIKDSSVTRVIHAGSWQERVEKVINDNNIKINSIEDAKKLLKKNEE